MELKYKTFNNIEWLVEFVNKNHITRESIEHIDFKENGYCAVLWWE